MKIVVLNGAKVNFDGIIDYSCTCRAWRRVSVSSRSSRTELKDIEEERGLTEWISMISFPAIRLLVWWQF